MSGLQDERHLAFIREQTELIPDSIVGRWAGELFDHIDALTEQLAAERAESDRFHRELRDALTGNRQVVQR